MIKKALLNERFILLIIVLNAAVIFIEGFDFEKSRFSLTLEILDNFFTIIFIFEMIAKIRHFGVTDYFSSNWNVFDFTLVLIAVPPLISLVLHYSFMDLGFLLALRTFRIFKFLRFIRFLPGVNKVIKGAFKAAKSSVVIIISFIILNFIISLVSCFLFRDISPESFGNPLISFYSIFQVFTIEGWFEIPDKIIDNLDSSALIFLTRLYFILILFIGGIFGLSLVNSVFVDSMIADNNLDLEKKIDELDNKINKLLSEIDKNKS